MFLHLALWDIFKYKALPIHLTVAVYDNACSHWRMKCRNPLFQFFLHYSNFSSKFKVFDFSLHEIHIIGYIIWIVLLQDKRIQFYLVLDYFHFQVGWWQKYSSGRVHNFSWFSSVYTHILPNSTAYIDLLFAVQPKLIVDSGVQSTLQPNCNYQIVYCTSHLKHWISSTIWEFSLGLQK